MNQLTAVQRHYTIEDLPRRVEAALQSAGFEEGPVEWSTLASIDQFHVRGMEATKELAEALDLKGGETFLDVGSGFGGPARFLAGQYGCHVTGIDLTPAYIEVAQLLARRTGLDDRLTFVQGDALNLPFPEGSFDAAWMMHVGMNIEDKKRLYSGVYRALRPGGRLAIYDFVLGNGEPLIYPLPWAREPEISFLMTGEELTHDLQATGFREVVSTDRTPALRAWMADLQAAQAVQGAAPTLAPASPGLFNLVSLILESGGKEINANVGRNIAEGRLQLMQVIVQKA